VQVECQGQHPFNRLKINNLDYILELVRLGQIGLARLGIWRMRMKIGGMTRSARGRDKLSQALACRIETRVPIAYDRALLILPVVLLHRVSYNLWDCFRNQSQPKSVTIHGPMLPCSRISLSSVVDSCECGRVTMLIQLRRSQ
jgi:hypothetical protein